jgi:UDP-N-acetylglucosamine diphosphorylase/glucosamine-1-phosphate N-acetyltransferase
MPDAKLYIFDDSRARHWAPFSLSRPAGELLHGAMSLRRRIERAFGLDCAGQLSRQALVGFDEAEAAPCITLEDSSDAGPRLFVSSRAVPDVRDMALPEPGSTLLMDGRPVGWVVGPQEPSPSELWLRDPAAAPVGTPSVVVPGRVLERPWDLVAQNAGRLTADLADAGVDAPLPEGVIRIGDGPISLAADAVIEPGVYLDTREGGIRLEAGVQVEGPARLTGPLFLGAGTHVLGGAIASSTVGPHCKLRGELSRSVLLGYVNKAHDGYLGHALVGRWVNLGAFTTNSDLKNNYGTVRVWSPDGDLDTGLLKVGCFLGDHVKTGIGTLLNTGTVVGAGSNLFGGAMPSVAVPPFSWGSGADLAPHRLDAFLATAEQAMARRGVELTPGVRRILEAAWAATVDGSGG